MRLLGLDISLQETGYCILVDGEIEDIGALTPSTKDYDVRLVELVDALYEKAVDVDTVVIEGYSFGSKGSGLTGLAELRGALKYKLIQKKIPYVEIPVLRWRKIVFGKAIGKELVRLTMFKKFGLEHDSLDALEAFGTARAHWMENQ